MDALLVLLNVGVLIVGLIQLVRDILKERRSRKEPPSSEP